jgi:spermidine synthase
MSNDEDYSKWWHEDSGGIGLSHALDMELLHKEVSPFQTIEIFEHKTFGRILVLDGLIQAAQSDEFIYHEMAVHVPLLGRHRDSATVVIVGGGDGGILREVLRHDEVKRVIMVEIDRMVIDLSNQYLGINGDYDDPRVELICADAADYLRKAAIAGETYDLIVLDLTEPVGPSSTVFTEAFCQDLSICLRPDGVVLDSDSILIGRDQVRFLQEICGDKDDNLVTVMKEKKYLPHVAAYRSIVPLYPGAEFGFFLYSKDGFSYAEPFRDFLGRHYNAGIHRAAFALPTWWHKQLGF